MNIIMNCAFSHVGFILKLNNKGAQCVAPAIIAKTAPIDKT